MLTFFLSFLCIVCVLFPANKSRRVELSTASLLKVAPTDEERKIVHSLFLNTLDTKYDRDTLKWNLPFYETWVKSSSNYSPCLLAGVCRSADESREQNQFVFNTWFLHVMFTFHKLFCTQSKDVGSFVFRLWFKKLYIVLCVILRCTALNIFLRLLLLLQDGQFPQQTSASELSVDGRC